MKTDQTVTEFDSEEKTQPLSIGAAIRQHARDASDGVPETLPDEVTQPIKFGISLGEPPSVPMADVSPATLTFVTDQDDLVTVSEVDDFDLSDFEDKETLVPTGDE